MRIRECDNWGCGHFGASRGKRIHKGVDIIVTPDSPFFAITQGTVTKIGYTYSDDLSFRYVELTDRAGARWRYFYIEPCVKVGDKIQAYDKIGTTQSLQERYPGMTEHCHLEIIKANGEYIDPTGIVADR